MAIKNGIAETPEDRQAQLWPVAEWFLEVARPKYEWIPELLWKALERLAKHFLLVAVRFYRRTRQDHIDIRQLQGRVSELERRIE